MSSFFATVMTKIISVGDEAALDRPGLHYESAAMAWIRTSVSSISFVFSIYKFFVFRDQHVASAVVIGPRPVGSGEPF
jgi:uncharacterized membrane protein YidH (DUF202 family)